MPAKRKIPVEQFCTNYNIEVAFIRTLSEQGLTEISVIDDTPYIFEKNIKGLERMIRMHYELDINIEGIEAISHLLERLDSLHEELRLLKNRLRFFEPSA
jgi:chaperone modulatory protein CbpM